MIHTYLHIHTYIHTYMCNCRGFWYKNGIVRFIVWCDRVFIKYITITTIKVVCHSLNCGYTIKGYLGDIPTTTTVLIPDPI